MKIVLTSLLFLTCLGVMAQTKKEEPAISIQEAPIMPRDLGGYKWVMNGKGGETDVVIFRVTKTQKAGEKEISQKIYDTVHRPGNWKEGCKETVFFYNPNYFDSPRGKTWFFKIPGLSGGISGDSTSYQAGGHHARVTFYNTKTGLNTTFEFEVIVMSYEEATNIHPDLLASVKKTEEMGVKWSKGTFTLKEKSEEKDAGEKHPNQ